MLKRMFFVMLFIAAWGGLGSGSAHAEPQLMGQYKDWSVYCDNHDGKAFFYACTRPQKSEGKYTTRGDVYLVVTSCPKDKSYNVVSFHAGYPFKDGATATVRVDQKAFTAFARDEACWFTNDVDPKVVSALGTGQNLVVEAMSARGTKTLDHFSLAGSSAALKALDQAARKP